MGNPDRPNDFNNDDSGIFCISDVQEFETLLAVNADIGQNLFIATWSISECPVHLRNSILQLVRNFDTLLMAYQEKFQCADNIDFFKDWMKKMNVIWAGWNIEQLPKNRYLVGKRVQQIVKCACE